MAYTKASPIRRIFTMAQKKCDTLADLFGAIEHNLLQITRLGACETRDTTSWQIQFVADQQVCMVTEPKLTTALRSARKTIVKLENEKLREHRRKAKEYVTERRKRSIISSIETF